MALTPGTRLGPYEISPPIGAGGMGEVYRARDTKLGREVAIKVLPDAFAHDAERLARFEREAQDARLPEPSPHRRRSTGSKKSSGVQALVMELVEGEDLAAAHRARADPARRSAADRAARSPRRSKRRTSRASSIAI